MAGREQGVHSRRQGDLRGLGCLGAALGGVFVAGTVYYFTLGKATDASWLGFWQLLVWLALGLGAVVTVWFLIGGMRDLKDMFHLLRTKVRDDSDDGRVRTAAETATREKGFPVVPPRDSTVSDEEKS